MTGVHLWDRLPADLPRSVAGGKAASLADCSRAGLPVPPWFVIGAPDDDDLGLRPGLAAEIEAACAAVAPHGERLAVRSSAVEEDSAKASFAGQFESFLDVAPDAVADRVTVVRRSASAPRVLAYRAERRLEGPPRVPAVLVQRMVPAVASGVAFGADPLTGDPTAVVVNAVTGLGDKLVAGEVDAEGWRVDAVGDVTRTSTGQERVLGHEEVRAVAELARRATALFGAPQDIEWAYDDDGALWLLQSRPITTAPDGPLVIWDNSNIAESYSGVTTPLTFSFARPAYEGVYRRLLRIFGVSGRVIDANSDVLAHMIGLVRGRVYYNLLNWYRALALLPGYRANRRFMEKMMGVREPLPEELAAAAKPPGAGARFVDLVRLGRSAVGLAIAFLTLPRRIRRFEARLARVLAPIELEPLTAPQIADRYEALESELLPNWDAPLVNDFAAMVFFGLTGVLAKRWCADAPGTLPNDLLAGEGGMISAEPARRIRDLARLAAPHADLVTALSAADDGAARLSATAVPEFRTGLDAYLERFGDRCLEELKLESRSLTEDPTTLLRAIGGLAERVRRGEPIEPGRSPRRAAAEAAVASALRGHPLRRRVFAVVLEGARARVRDRENLRFERTRLFGRVRRLFLAAGDRLVAAGRLDEDRDVFYLRLPEVLEASRGGGEDLRPLVAARRAEFDGYRAEPAPPDRFEVRGSRPIPARLPEGPVEADSAQGVGCSAGVVRGPVRLVTDPRSEGLRPGEILVAERTDPGWVMLFPSASGLLVERGSLLSHSAIVARELGLPAVVALPGLTRWLRTGDLVEFDGATGLVRRLAPGASAAGEPG